MTSFGSGPLDLSDAHAREALRRWLASAAEAADVSITSTARLAGGAIHENWSVDADVAGGPLAGAHALVLRAAAEATLAESHGIAREFAIARAAFDAGVTAPEPLWCCDDRAVLGRPFALSRRAPGVAAGHILVRDEKLGGSRPALLARLGVELARIHAIAPPAPALDFLPKPTPSPARAAVGEFRAALDAHGVPRPALEWGLNWLELHAPPAGPLVLVHGDFRTGNFLVDADGLCGILDWEFARWGDPLEDIGWFTARCWRFGRYDRPAGGLGPRAEFDRAYCEASRRELPPQAVHYWQVMAHVRWAIIALHQAERHTSGRQRSLELALTGRIVDELELEVLTLIEEANRGEFDG